MSVFEGVGRAAGRVTEGVQHRMRRARLEGERRVLQRQHRAAFEQLGRRTHELARDGRLPADELAPEIARVEAKQMEIDAKSVEIDALREPEGD
jgi:hypothetical protein